MGKLQPGLDAVVRLLLAAVCGGIIGFDRGRRNRPAGFRTHILVCVGAALTMLVGQYIALTVTDAAGTIVKTDISRISAQVINGIGFLGAGTIIITGRQEITGLTTAAGLWASASMGIAIGAGFYLGAVLGCFLLLICVTLLRRVESAIMSRARNMNIYVEMSEMDNIRSVINVIKERKIKIYDIEINREKHHEGGARVSMIVSMRLPDMLPHADIIGLIAAVESIETVEEI